MLFCVGPISLKSQIAHHADGCRADVMWRDDGNASGRESDGASRESGSRRPTGPHHWHHSEWCIDMCIFVSWLALFHCFLLETVQERFEFPIPLLSGGHVWVCVLTSLITQKLINHMQGK